MAAPYNPPVKGEDFVMYVPLDDYANPGNFKADPTIAAGDFKIKKDTGTFTNLATLPVVDNAGEKVVRIALSSTEMNADNVVIQCIDQTATKEWADAIINIVTTV